MFTYRKEGHSTSDDPTGYRPKEEPENWPLGDPIERLAQHLRVLGEWDDARQAAMDGEIDTEVRAAQKQAEENGVLRAATIDFPQQVETMFEDVYAELPWNLKEQQAEMKAELSEKLGGGSQA